MTRTYDFTSPDQITPEVQSQMLDYLMGVAKRNSTVNQLDRLCVQTVSGEIEFMDEDAIDELKLSNLSQGGKL